ncbi:MAG: VOC family protein [Calditrichia bacterium]
MAESIYPCLWFNGKAKEAAEFYGAIFRDKGGFSGIL